MAWSNPKTDIKTVGLIGCGTMGRQMVEKLIAGGYAVNGYDKFPVGADAAKKLGAIIYKTPAQVAQKSDMVIISLPGPVQINEVFYGEDGLFEALRDGQVVVDTSTSTPGNSLEISERASEKGVAVLDCPILGRPSTTGKWLLPTGGDAEAMEYVKPVLSHFAATIVSVGRAGNGNAIKLLNQLMFGCINAISSEVFAICDCVGIEREIFYNTIASSSAATVSGLFKEVGKNIVAEDYTHPSFTVDLLIKDISLAQQMAKEADAPSVMAGHALLFHELAHAQGLGSEDTSALFKVFEKHYTNSKRK